MSIQDTERYQNFLKGATLSKREVISVIDDIIKKTEKKEFLFPISDFCAGSLWEALTQFRDIVMGTNLPTIKKPFASYKIDLLDNCIQLGVIEHDKDDSEFDENGSELLKTLGDYPNYKQVCTVYIQSIPLSVWAENNNVNYVTAKSWAQNGFMRTFPDGGHNIRVSKIQYPPFNIFANENLSVIFRGHSKIPAEITKRHETIAGEVQIAVISGVRDHEFTVTIMSQKPDSLPHATNITLPAADRRKIIRQCNNCDGLKRDSWQVYQPPIDGPKPGYAFRHTCLRPRQEDLNVLKDVAIKAELNAKSIFAHADPTFTITLSKNGHDIMELTGKLLITPKTPEYRLLRAIFDNTDTVSDWHKVLAHLDASAKDDPWHQSTAYINGLQTCMIDEETAISILKSLKTLIFTCTLFDPPMIIVRIPDEHPAFYPIHEMEHMFTAAGYESIPLDSNDDSSRPLFYAYCD